MIRPTRCKTPRADNHDGSVQAGEAIFAPNEWETVLDSFDGSSNHRRRFNCQIFYVEDRRRAWQRGDMQLIYEDGLTIEFDSPQTVAKFIFRQRNSNAITGISLTLFRGGESNREETAIATADDIPVGGDAGSDDMYEVLRFRPVSAVTAVRLTTTSRRSRASRADCKFVFLAYCACKFAYM